MNNSSDNSSSGKRWARFALIFGAVMSVLGNETHTVLTPGHVAIALRMVLALIWPVALFIAVEVFVRVDWRRSFIDYAGRAVMLVPVGMVAAVVSYQHLHALMRLAGEDRFSATVGPLAIDGLMIGGTVALLAIRAATLSVPASVLDDWDNAIDELTAEPVPVSAPPEQTRERAPRVKPTDVGQVNAVTMIADGRKTAEIVAETHLSVATVNRWRAAYNVLRDNPRATLSKPAPPAEVVTLMREKVSVP